MRTGWCNTGYCGDCPKTFGDGWSLNVCGCDCHLEASVGDSEGLTGEGEGNDSGTVEEYGKSAQGASGVAAV